MTVRQWFRINRIVTEGRIGRDSPLDVIIASLGHICDVNAAPSDYATDAITRDYIYRQTSQHVLCIARGYTDARLFRRYEWNGRFYDEVVELRHPRRLGTIYGITE